jgi:pantothenate synthetase
LKADVMKLISSRPGARADYIAFFDPHTLQPDASVGRGAHLALAVFFGKTRLIDNANL